MNQCNYDLFAKMKEPLPRTRYKIREGIICAVGWSLLDINRSECAHGVQCLPQIWNVVHMGGVILLCLPQVIKSFQNFRGVVATFYPTLVYHL
jgi:hypothetical protein